MTFSDLWIELTDSPEKPDLCERMRKLWAMTPERQQDHAHARPTVAVRLSVDDAHRDPSRRILDSFSF